METNPYIKQIIKLNNEIIDRRDLHKLVAPILQKMGKDNLFWEEVFERNLKDTGFLKRNWTMYEIPFLYVYESDDFYVKVHLFPALESKETNLLTSAIHHHNNYLLTTFAAYGSGYETFLFEKDIKIDKITKETNLKIRERFKQKERPVHLVDSWEPHVVVNPESMSATLVFWSPDKKRITDKLRNNLILKGLKTPLRKMIYLLGMDKDLGIAAKETYQWYPHKNKFIAVPEDEFFAPTRLQSGSNVNDYSINTIFHFMQNMGYKNLEFLKEFKMNPNTPAYFHKWVDKLISNELIPETFAKGEINVPEKKITIEDLESANRNVNSIN